MLYTCPDILDGDHWRYEVIPTPSDGNCFYTTIEKLMILSRGPNADYDRAVLRRRVREFFTGDPSQLSAELRDVYNHQAEQIKQTLLAYAVDPSNSALYEIATDNPRLVTLASQPDDRALMQAYGEAVGEDFVWANSHEAQVLARLLKVRICVYEPIAEAPNILQTFNKLGEQDDPKLAVKYSNVGPRGALAHYEGLKIYASVPAPTAPMELGSVCKRPLAQDASLACVFEALAAAMTQRGTPTTAADLRAEVATWARATRRAKEAPRAERRAAKAVAHAVSLEALPYALRSNILVYNAHGEASILVEAHAPFSCAQRFELLRVANEPGDCRYAVMV